MKPASLLTTRRERESGFTLIELLVAISLTGIILVTLGFAVTEGFQNTTATRASIDRSIMSDFAARYFAADVASAAFGPGSVVTTNPPACDATGIPIIDIQTSSTKAVSYTLEQDVDDGGKSLMRSACSGTVTGTLTLLSRRQLGSTDGTLAPTASCTTTSCALTLSWGNPTYSITVSGTRWVNATTTTAP